MNDILTIYTLLLSSLPLPIFWLLSLVIFVGILICLLKLIKLILDAIPFV